MSVYGQTLRVMTFGESHGGGVGCILEGVPPGLELDAEDVQVVWTLFEAECLHIRLSSIGGGLGNPS